MTIKTEYGCFDHEHLAMSSAAAKTLSTKKGFLCSPKLNSLRVFLGCTTTSVCRHPCLRCLLWDPAWLNDPVLPPTPPGTDGAETKLTPKAPELTPQAHLQPSVSNMYGLNPKDTVPNTCAAFLLSCCRWRLNALPHLTFLVSVLINCCTYGWWESSNSVDVFTKSTFKQSWRIQISLD